MARKSGRVGSLEIQADGVGGNGGWNAVTLKRDLSITSEAAKQDASASESVNVYIPGPIDLVISGQIPTDTADTQYQALQASFEARTTIGYRALDTVSTGAGWVFDGVLTKFDETKNRGDIQMTTIEIVPAPSATAPAWKDPT
jgi:hypothetical protein